MIKFPLVHCIQATTTTLLFSYNLHCQQLTLHWSLNHLDLQLATVHTTHPHCIVYIHTLLTGMVLSLLLCCSAACLWTCHWCMHACMCTVGAWAAPEHLVWVPKDRPQTCRVHGAVLCHATRHIETCEWKGVCARVRVHVCACACAIIHTCCSLYVRKQQQIWSGCLYYMHL